MPRQLIPAKYTTAIARLFNHLSVVRQDIEFGFPDDENAKECARACNEARDALSRILDLHNKFASDRHMAAIKRRYSR